MMIYPKPFLSHHPTPTTHHGSYLPQPKMSNFSILGIGGIYEDVILTVPRFPHEDSKLRATSRTTRLGGNIPNTLGMLSQILTEETEKGTNNWRLFFMGALGDNGSSVYVLFFCIRTSLMKSENKISETRVGKKTYKSLHPE